MAYDVPDLRVLVYAADTGARRDFPKRHLQSAEWSDERYGGWKEFSLSLAADVTELTITPADKVEIYWQDVLRYRGWVTQIERMEGDPPSLKIQGNGLILQAGRCLVQRPYVYAGSVDVAQAFRDAASDAVAPVLPDAVIDAQDVGATLTVLEATNKPFIEALNGLAEQAQNLCLFGGDVDDDNADRLYFKPFNVATDYTLQVPGLGVTGASAQTVSADLANRVKIIGGNAQDPNLIYNSSFERPRFGGEGVGNLLHDPSFENNTDWSIGSGGSRKQKGGQEGQPYHGSYMVEVDNSGEYAQQTQNPPDTAITVGHDYTFSLWAKCESEADAVAGTAVLTWLTSGGSTISTETITLASPLSGSTPRLSATWQQWKLTSRAPATAAGFKVRIECTSGGGAGKGILADLVEVYDSFVLYQDGWELTTYGSAVANVVNWVYKDPAGSYDGAHCVYVDISATDSNGQDAILQPLARQRFAVLGGATYIVSVWLKSPPGITSNGKIQLELWEYKSDGSLVSGTSSKVTIAAGSGWSDWTQYTFTRTVAQTATHAMVYLCFRGNSKVLIDGFCMRGSAAGTTYIREGQYEEQIDVTDGDLTGLESGVADSIDDYGIWDEVVRVDSITNRADALSYAAAFFNARAVPLPSPFVEIAGPADQFRPGELVRLLGAHGTALMGGQSSLPIVRARWSYDGILRVRLEMKRERPNMAEEIVKKLRKQLQPPAAVTYSQGVAGTASGTGGGGGAPVTPGGSDGDVQYNNGSAGFAGESVLNYDATNNQLSVPGLSLGEDLLFNNVLRPTSLTTDTNDYEPTNWATGTVFCINATGDIDLTGLEAATDGQVKILINTGATTITLVKDSSSSTAGNRFLLSADVALLPEQGVILLYEDPPPSGMTDTLGRWRLLQVFSSASVAGSDKQIQFNDGGVLGAEAGFEYDKTTDQASVPGLTITQDLATTGDITPSQITSNQNDYNPTGLSTTTVVRLSSDAARDVTGLQGGSDGRWLVPINVGSYTITLKNASGSSTAANRFSMGSDLALEAGAGCILIYDGTQSRWALATPRLSTTAPFVVDFVGTTGDGSYNYCRIYNLYSGSTHTIGADFTVQGGGMAVVINHTGGSLTVSAYSGWTMENSDTVLGDGESAIYFLGQPGGAGSNRIYTVFDGSATGGGGGGTVTSVALSLPAIFSVSGSPVTTSGTLTGSLANQSANTVFSGPSSGSAAAPTFRALVAADIPQVSLSRRLTEWNDFLFNKIVYSTVSGTGASADIADNYGDTGGHPGVLIHQTGTTTTGRAFSGTFGAYNGAIKLGYGVWTYETCLYLDALSDGTDTYTIRVGMLDATSGDPTDGVFFRYTHGTNSGKFEAVTRSNSSETATDTGHTVAATTWVKIGFSVNADATSVTFYVNGSLVATNTTNIPTGGRNTSMGTLIQKSAGTTNRLLYQDYYLVDCLLSTPR